MVNSPLAYTLIERKATIGTMAENSTLGLSYWTQAYLGDKL